MGIPNRGEGGGARTPMQKCLWTYHRIVRFRKDILQMSQFWFTCTWLLSRCGIFIIVCYISWGWVWNALWIYLSRLPNSFFRLMISIIKTILIIFVAKAMINLALSKPLVIVLDIVYHHFLSLIISNVICIAFDP